MFAIYVRALSKIGCGIPVVCGRTRIGQIEGGKPGGERNNAAYEFHREVFATPEMLAIFAGHIHKPSLDLHCGKAQIVVPGLAAAGEFMELRLCREPAAGQ